MSAFLYRLPRGHLCALLSVFAAIFIFSLHAARLQNQGNMPFPISPPPPRFLLSLIYRSLSARMCVLSLYPRLPVPRGGISSLHLFEVFLIWGLGQPQSGVPSSIIPVEEQREGEEGVQKRRKSKGDGVISYLSPHSSALPISSNWLSPSLSPSLFRSILASYLSIPPRLTCIQSAILSRQPSPCPSAYLSVRPIV